jgi:hypothetical protein
VIFIIALAISAIKCTSLGNIRYISSNLAVEPGWSIVLKGVSEGGRIGGSYWGERWYYVQYVVQNSSNQARFFGTSCDHERHMMRFIERVRLGAKFEEDPDFFDIESYRNCGNPRLEIQLEELNTPQAFVFFYNPETGGICERISMIGRLGLRPHSYFHRPMDYPECLHRGSAVGGDTGEYNRRRWLRPGESLEIINMFALPEGAIPTAYIKPGVFKADLRVLPEG